MTGVQTCAPYGHDGRPLARPSWPPKWWQGFELFSCRRIAAVELIHHRGDPGGGEYLRSVGRARDHALDFVRFVLIELRQHVIREIAPRVSAPDAQPQPGKLVAD